MYSPVNTAGPNSPNMAVESQWQRFKPGRSRKHAGLIAWLSEHPTPLANLACFCAALLVVIFARPEAQRVSSLAAAFRLRVSIGNIAIAAVLMVLWSVLLRATVAHRSAATRALHVLLEFVLQTVLCTAVLVPLLAVVRPHMVRLPVLGMFAAVGFSGLLICRLCVTFCQKLLKPMMRRRKVALIVGYGPRGRETAAQLASHPKFRYRFLGFVDPDPQPEHSGVLGTLATLEAILVSNPIDEVIISLPVKSKYDDIQRTIAICEGLGIQSRYSSNLFATQITKRRSVDQHDPSSVLLHMVHDTGVVLKRLVDVILASVLLVLLAPLLIVVAICVRATSEGPIFFLQQRYGLNRRLFTMYKFRSMVVNAEKLQANLEAKNETGGPAFKMTNDPRITRVGRFLRTTSIDELPQLWNVLIGDMSLVGPRPLPIRDVERFSEAWLMRRFSVPPGITGLWQVSGRSSTSFAHWIKLDLEYIDRWSLLLDMEILFKTFSVVLGRKGAV